MLRSQYISQLWKIRKYKTVSKRLQIIKNGNKPKPRRQISSRVEASFVEEVPDTYSEVIISPDWTKRHVFINSTLWNNKKMLSVWRRIHRYTFGHANKSSCLYEDDGPVFFILVNRFLGLKALIDVCLFTMIMCKQCIYSYRYVSDGLILCKSQEKLDKFVNELRK